MVFNKTLVKYKMLEDCFMKVYKILKKKDGLTLFLFFSKIISQPIPCET